MKRTIPTLILAAGALVLGPSSQGASSATGELIAFERRSGTGVADIYVVRPDGTGLRRLTRTSNNFDPAWSPDGTRIAFASDRVHGAGAPEIFVMDADGANVRRLTTGGRAKDVHTMFSQPTWTPDGEAVVYVATWVRGTKSTTDLWRIGADGSGNKRLTRHRGRESSPAYTPNGRLSFERDGKIYAVRTGGLQLVARGTEPAWSSSLVFVRDGDIYAADGRGERKIAQGTAPAWSADGTRIVYSTLEGLYSVTPQGTDRRRITSVPSLIHDLAPSWRRSPGRSLHAAEARELAFTRAGDIFAVGSDGTGLRRLTSTRSREFSPEWSPDGRRLAFAREDVIYVRDANGRERRLGPGFGPRWSPGGRWIAFTTREGPAFAVQLMRADGSHRRRLITGASPAWSPNGRLIAFSSDRETPENPEIYVIRPDGTGLKRLTHTAGGVELLGDDGFPDWSPDGKRIVFTSNRNGEGELWVMRADGTGERRLAGLPRRDDFSPRFSPDGALIAFESHTLGRTDVYLVRSDGTGIDRLAVRASSPAWRPR